MQSLKSIKYLSFVALFLFVSQKLIAQTDLQPGDIAIIGVNANSAACGGSGGEDVITFVAFKDIVNGTEFDITDNGWERVSAGLWGDSEGIYRMTRTGGTITAGTTFELTLITSLAATQAANTDWSFTDLNVPSSLDRNVNMNSGGDQMYVMQGGNWNNGGETGEHDATYDGKILYGFNTRTVWNADGSSQQSNLHPQVDPCFFMNPTGGTTNYVNYTGPLTATTQLEWINRIKDPTNWTSYTSCTAYDNNPPPSFLPITTSEMSLDCTICTGGCSAYNETLIFNLPSSGGPFDVTYTDGTNTFTLLNINDGHTEVVSVSSNTTFSLVSVTAANDCPIYSNFAGEAVITFSGTGGGANAVLSGGGVLCTDNCTTITVTISGGTAPYTLDAVVNFPPIVNNFPISTPATVTNFQINVCSQGSLPSYDVGTNTLFLPNFITGNLTFALTGITDNSGCAGTVDPTPLGMTIEQTPTANPAGPLTECDEGGNTATFDLTALNGTVNGGSSNTVTWYQDMALNTVINNAANYSTTSTTVYATSSTTDCESDPVAVQLIVNPSPTANMASLTDCTPTGIATFDLTSVNSIVNGGTGASVSWFTNSAGTNPILNPTNYTTNSSIVYASVFSNGCSSVPVAVILTVDIAPIAVSTNMTVCESTTIPTFGDFDLTTINNIVNGGTGLSVAWFTDAAATNPIPGSFITTQDNTTVYAVVGTAPCTSMPTLVTLFVTPTPIANSTSLSECASFGNQAVFDLTSIEGIVNGGSGFTVSWFEDINGNNPIFLPNSYLSGGGLVYAQTSAGLCSSGLVPITLNVLTAPSATPTNATACDSGNGTATFDLNTIAINVNNDPGNTVNWYLDMNGTIPIPSPYITGSTNVYAQVTNGTCESQIVEVGLAIDIAPTATSTTSTLCDSGNGTATFDLNVLALSVNNDLGNTVNWFSDINGTNPIASPYNTSTTTIFAQVTNGNCDSPITPVTLTVEAAPIANNAAASVCDLGNGTGDFDLTLIENTVNGGNGNTVSWFSDINATLPISSPYNSSSTTIYATTSNGNCNSNVATITLSVEAAPVANAATSDVCDLGNGTADFDLDALALIVNTNPAYSVNWFLYANGTNPIVVSPFNTPTTFVYAVVSDGAGCESLPTQVDLNVIATPSATPTSAEECELANGMADFDLTTLENTVNGGTANTVSWYSDANGTLPITSPYSTSSTTVYAIVNGALCSSAAVPVDLNVNAVPMANSTNVAVCDNTGTGTADFDLVSLENTVNGGNGNTVLWYSDAGVTNSISSPYNTSSTTIYATVVAGNCSSAVVPVDLLVNNLPTANPASAELCDSGDGTATFDLTALENIINGGTTDPVTFYSDMAGTMGISSPYNTATTTVYATVTVGNCTSNPIAINLTVGNSPTINPTSTSLCDEGGGMASFDLTSLENTVGSGNVVTWYSDAGATNMITSPFMTATTTIYAIVGDANCASDPVAVDLMVDNLPVANSTSTSLCDEGNGMATFDLLNLENIINGGNGNTVLWYSDVNTTMSIASPFVTSSTTIYAVVSNGSCISDAVSVDLAVTIAPAISTASASLCDEGGSMATFDLASLENTVNSGTGNMVTWYADANGTTEITSPFNSSSTTIYAIVSDGTCLSSIEAITLMVTDLPEANTATVTNCDSGNGTADFDLTAVANTVNGGTGNTVTWYSDAALTTSITSPFNSAATTIYAVVDDGNCTAEAVEVMLEVTNDITANPSSLAACDEGTGTAIFDLTDLNFQNNITGGNGNSISWYLDAAAMNPLAPPYDAFETAPTSIYAVVGSGNCSSLPVEISLVYSPVVPVASNFSIANCDSGNGTASFDLDSQNDIVNTGNGNQVLWFEDQNLTTPISSPYVTGATIIYAVATDGICFSEYVEVMLEISNDLPAFPAMTSACDDGSGTATFNLTLLENTVNGGNGNAINWYSDANATTTIPNIITTGNTSVYAIVTDGTCTSQIVEITLAVENDLQAFPTTTSACDDGSGTATFDLTLLENTVNGGNGNMVNWYSDANATTTIPNTITTGNTSVYAIVTDGTCTSQIVEITLTVENDLPAFPTMTSACDDGSGTATFDLTLLENTINGGNGNMVNWYSDASATTSIPNTITSGNTSVYAIVTDGTCTSQIVEITLTLENALSAFPTMTSACDDGSGTATFDLTLLENTVNGGTGNTVNWYSDGGAATPIPTSVSTSSTSVYALVTDGTCTSQVVEINLVVADEVPAFPTMTSACNDGSGTATFDLSLLENTVNGGTGNTVNWYSDANATTTIPNTITTGNTSVYAIVTDGTCTSQIVEISLTVENNLQAFSTMTSACDDGSGTATFDLTLLENTVNGATGNTVNWYSDASATSSIPSMLTTSSTSVFAIVTDGTCTSQIVEISLTVEDDLQAFPTMTSACDDGNGTSIFDLSLLENTVNGGTGNTVNWYSDAGTTTAIPNIITTGTTSVYAVVTNGNCFSQPAEIELNVNSNSTNDIIETLCDGESMMVNNVLYNELNAVGTEIIVGGNSNGCDSIINIDLTFEPEITGTITASTNSVCPGNDVILTFTLTGGTTYDVEYAVGANPPIVLNGISDGHTITVAPTNTTTYSLEAVTPLNTNCTGVIPTSQVTIQVEAIEAVASPTSQFGNFNISCFGENDGAAVAVPTSGTAPFQFLWSNGNTTPTISNVLAGDYEVTITDANGCFVITSTALSQPDAIQLDAFAIAPPCSAVFDGQIILNNVTGGTGNYTASIDGGGFAAVQNNPTVFDFIAPGEHTLTISDDNGCLVTEDITVGEPLEVEVSLGSDETIQLGEVFEIQAMPNFIPTEIIWSANSNCDSCLIQLVSPTDQTTYSVIMSDENGCVASDTITIFVEKNQNVFIPNAFSPDDNGFNDIFYINAGQDVAEVRKFRIFNRWGEVVFENENFQPNDPTEGWDGFFNGEKLNPSVLVFFAEIEFKDGFVKIYKGDVTLTR